MKELINPVPVEVLEEELSRDKLIRKTNYADNEIYVVSAHNSPNVMQEIGRLREISFRTAGGGTGKTADIDDYDTAETPYYQLIVWEPREKEIIGGYRFINCASATKDDTGKFKLATTGLFDFSEKFINEYLPYTIELGRSFVRPEYQAKNAGRKALFALDNLWDGLGAITMEKTDAKYFFGKITMYGHFDNLARDMILYFMSKYFKDKENLMTVKSPLGLTSKKEVLNQIFTGENYDADYKILMREVRRRNENIPPLFNSYMNLSPSMKVFGTAINHKFGGVEETGILLTIKDIYPTKKDRHITSYSPIGFSF